MKFLSKFVSNRIRFSDMQIVRIIMHVKWKNEGKKKKKMKEKNETKRRQVVMRFVRESDV